MKNKTSVTFQNLSREDVRLLRTALRDKAEQCKMTSNAENHRNADFNVPGEQANMLFACSEELGRIYKSFDVVKVTATFEES